MDIGSRSDKMDVDVVQESPFQMLNIDTLLIIFNMLSLFDKLSAMRVCKTWHHIISKHHAWTVIDFRDREDGPQRKVEESRKRYKRFVSKTGPNVFEYRECGNPCIFLNTKANVLKFLKHYAGVSLQELYIGGATGRTIGYDEIFEYLEMNCPNIRIIDIRIYESHEKFHLNPQFLKKVKLHFHCTYLIPSDFPDQYILYISTCSHLQMLDITMADLYLAGMKTLSKMTQLRELDIYFKDTFYTTDLFSKFESTVRKLVFLRAVRLTLSTKGDFENFNQILKAIGHWTHLEILALHTKGAVCEFTSEALETMVSGLINLETLELRVRGMVASSVATLIGTHLKKLKTLQLCDDSWQYDDIADKLTSEAFEIMITGCLYLETLELEGGFVTSSIVNPIGIHLMKLKSLRLSRGSYFAESLQTLSHHPALENLVVMQSYQDVDNWIRNIHRILATLPKLRQVKMEVRKLAFEDIENINLDIYSAEVEVIHVVGKGPLTQEIDSCVIAREKKWKKVNAR